MSRQISSQVIEDGELTYAEAIWLRDRGKLPPGYEIPDPPDDADEPYSAPTKVTPLEEQSVPTIGAKGGIVGDDEEEEYEDGWSNPQRRAELEKRGLNIEGRKDDLIGRLRRSDAEELTQDDYSTVG